MTGVGHSDPAEPGFKTSGWSCQRLGDMTGSFDGRSQEEGSSWAASCLKCLEVFPWSAPSLSPTWLLPLTGAAWGSRAGLSDSSSQGRMG